MVSGAGLGGVQQAPPWCGEEGLSQQGRTGSGVWVGALGERSQLLPAVSTGPFPFPGLKYTFWNRNPISLWFWSSPVIGSFVLGVWLGKLSVHQPGIGQVSGYLGTGWPHESESPYVFRTGRKEMLAEARCACREREKGEPCKAEMY